MRIIAGDFKGRKLETPIGYDIRPTTEKVKEAIFSILMNNIYDANVCDLFSGTGNLGLEALSRGAKKCYFCDNSKDSLNLTKKNISACKAEDMSIVLPGDFEKCLSRVFASGDKIDIFILDPPYREGLYERCFELIREYDLLAEDGVILCEHERKDEFENEYFGYELIKERFYGSIAVSIYGWLCNFFMIKYIR